MGSPEAKNQPKPENIQIDNPVVIPVSDISETNRPVILNQLAQIYFETWKEKGLCDSLESASTKIKSFAPENITIVCNGQQTEVYALVVSVGLVINKPKILGQLEEISLQIPTYKNAEDMAGKTGPKNPTHRVCFTINAKSGYRVKAEGREKGIPLSEFLIRSMQEQESSVRIIAYSRFDNVEKEQSLLGFYMQNIGISEKLGASGMHEHYGGIIGAILEHSRMEDETGGRGNVLVVYPVNHGEEERYSEIRSKRQREKVFSVKRHANVWFINDLELDARM